MERRNLYEYLTVTPASGTRTNTAGYFHDKSITFFSSGCTLLDCVLGGGWPVGRVVNIVGDKSTGKTLLVIEAAINHLKKFPNSKVAYRESEAAFSKEYAEQQLGLPVDRIDWADSPLVSVEDFFEDLAGVDKKKGFLDSVGPDGGLYILDSLDALSDRAELDRNIDAGSFGAQKAKKMSELFRRLVQLVEEKNVTLIIVSQVRENIGVTFGRKYSRSGGKALDFYASIVLYLAQKSTIELTIKGVTRKTGVSIKAHCDKNKVGLPLRECEFNILFGYGMDDIAASLGWMLSVKHFPPKVVELIGKVESERDLTQVIKHMSVLNPVDYKHFNEVISAETVRYWEEIETKFLPVRKKY